MAKILIAEDDEQIRLAYELVLSAAGYHITSTGDGDEAARLLADGEFDLLMTDLMMPNKDGIAVLKVAHELENPPRILVITGGMESIAPYAALELSQSRVDSYLIKPVETDVLLSKISEILTGSE